MADHRPAPGPSAPRLTGTSLAVLGMVGLRGPSTAYELRRAVGRLSGEFWDVPHAMVYHETRRLESEGLLASEQEVGGRRRRTYRLTEAGTEAIANWLSRPDTAGMEIRDEGQLQLLFSELADGANLAALATAQVDVYLKRLAALDEVESRTAGLQIPPLRLLPLQLGRRVYQAGLDFWAEVAESSGAPRVAP